MGGSSILQRNGPCAMDSGPEQATAITRKRTKRFAKQTQQVGKGAPCPLAAVHDQGFATTAPGSSKEHTKHHLELLAHAGKTQLLRSCLSLESA